MTTKLKRIGKKAVCDKETVFNNIGCVIDLDLLRESYHELDGRKAIGIDGVTKSFYGKSLEENLQVLLKKIRSYAYKPQASRLVEIPKEDGSKRPLAISCFEDKIVQNAVAKVLSAIFEPTFLPCSYGYRENIGAHEALRDLMRHSNKNPRGVTVEIDLQRYFNTIPHEKLIGILQEKIADKRFLKLVERLMRSPIIVDGRSQLNEIGCPQGSIISPILSNIYLHHVIDAWFSEIKQSHLQGRAELIRFADDMVWVFQNKEDAERFYKVLPKRLEKFGLKMHESKSSMIESGSITAAQAHKRKSQIPTYKFLGFTCYWGQSRNGWWRLKYKTRSDRVTTKLNGLRKFLKENRNKETFQILSKAKQVVRGWINYHAVSDNQKRVSSFILESKRAIFAWLNRKGGKRRCNWKKFGYILEKINFPQKFKTKSMFETC